MLANADGSGARRLAVRKVPAYYNPYRLSWSPDGTVIAAGAGTSAGGLRETAVAVAVADGSEKPLTAHEWLQTKRLSWLSDGHGLVLQAVDAESAGRDQLWLVAYPGGEVRRITNDLNSYSDATLSTDSSALVTVQRDQLTSLWVAPQGDARRARQTSSGTGKYDGVNGLAWTPDGRLVYASSASGNLDLWIMEADGTHARQLTTDPLVDRWPAVSPDGRSVVFTALRAGSSDLWRMDIDGGNLQPLTRADPDFPPEITPDGKWVLYSSSQSGQPALWKVPLAGGQPSMLSPVGYHGLISPDGKLVEYVFIDQKASRRRVAVKSWEGGEPLRVFDIAIAHSTRWSPDGRGLTYVETRDGVANLWLQPLDGGKPRQLTHFTSDNIFNYAWSRDGKQLAVVRGNWSSDVVLISNFR